MMMKKINSVFLGVGLMVLAAGCNETRDEVAVGRAVARAESAERIMPPAQEDRLLAAESGLPTAARIGRWARRFAEADSVEYRFGLADGGYVAEGELVRDDRQDCVSLMYRVTELARAEDHRDAVVWALRTRFAGAPADSLVDEQGRVNYDRPEHLDFSLVAERCIGALCKLVNRGCKQRARLAHMAKLEDQFFCTRRRDHCGQRG